MLFTELETAIHYVAILSRFLEFFCSTERNYGSTKTHFIDIFNFCLYILFYILLVKVIKIYNTTCQQFKTRFMLSIKHKRVCIKFLKSFLAFIINVILYFHMFLISHQMTLNHFLYATFNLIA